MTHATVTLNGTQVADHLGGYLPFSAEITGPAAARRGTCWRSGWTPPSTSTCRRTGRRRSPPRRWTTGSRAGCTATCGCGWCRGSSWPTCSPSRSTSWTPPPGRSWSRRRWTPPPGCAGPAHVAAELLDDGREIASARVPVAITGPGQVTVTATLSGLADIRLWDTDHPKLYTVADQAARWTAPAGARAPGADRVPRGQVRPRRVLPQRPPGQAVRRRPAPVLPVRRGRHARPGAGQGRRDHAARAELHHGALLALPAGRGLLRRLRRARADGLGGGPGVGIPRRRRLEGAGLPGHRGDDRPRPQPPVDHHLGRPAQRDPQRHRVLHQHERARARPGRLAADGRRDGRACA